MLLLGFGFWSQFSKRFDCHGGNRSVYIHVVGDIRTFRCVRIPDDGPDTLCVVSLIAIIAISMPFLIMFVISRAEAAKAEDPDLLGFDSIVNQLNRESDRSISSRAKQSAASTPR